MLAQLFRRSTGRHPPPYLSFLSHRTRRNNLRQLSTLSTQYFSNQKAETRIYYEDHLVPRLNRSRPTLFRHMIPVSAFARFQTRRAHKRFSSQGPISKPNKEEDDKDIEFWLLCNTAWLILVLLVVWKVGLHLHITTEDENEEEEDQGSSRS